MIAFIQRLVRWLVAWWRGDSPATGADESPAPVKPQPPLEVAEKKPDKWFGVAGAEVGTMHTRVNPPIPCQDAALAQAIPRPCAFVADGAGSARLSHHGSAETVLRLSHLAATLEDVHAQMLDAAETPSRDECRRHARRIAIHASETIKQLAADKSEPFKEFRCTLLAAVVGAKWVFWMKVGDGHIVREKESGDLQVVGPAGKGEYANVTRFVEKNAEATEFACGAFPSAEISGLALMTDGAAEKLVSSDGQKVAGRVTKCLAGIRGGKFAEQQLHDFLSDPKVWRPPGYTGDDKGIAFLSRAISVPSP